jgi:putative peptide zinc metalloprotease protein
LFLNKRLPETLFILVPLFAISAIIAWILVPIGKFIHYLATSGELTRTRGWAVASTLGGLGFIVVCLGILRVPDYCRIEGVVEPVSLAIVHAESDGFITGFLPSDQTVKPGEKVLVKAVNHELEAEKNELLAELQGLETKQHVAQMKEIAAAQILAEQIEALKEKIARVGFELSSLSLQPTLPGTWVSPDIEKTKGSYLHRGQQVGIIASLDDVRIRATAGQKLAALLVEQAYEKLEIRVKGRPDVMLTGRIEKIFPAGLEVLPSEALGYAVGGDMPTVAKDPSGKEAAEKFFEVRIRPNPDSSVHLLSGQRVVARIQMPSKPLAAQWWRSARQLFQRRFHI